MTISKVPLALLFKEGEIILKKAGVESPRREATLLIAAALQKSRAELLMMDKSSEIDPSLIRSFFTRRSRHEPYAYIIRQQGFWSLNLKVSESTLIPRADSESLIEALLKVCPDYNRVYKILDLGTGTGCLLLAALSEYPQSIGIGIDRVKEAVFLARDNAQTCNLSQRAAFVVGDWANAVNGQFDIILSNPPYILEYELSTLMPDVREYEPKSALSGGKDGLDAYRSICQQACNLLTDEGKIILEIGVGQEEHVINIAHKAGLSVVEKQQDLNGCIRALVFSCTKL